MSAHHYRSRKFPLLLSLVLSLLAIRTALTQQPKRGVLIHTHHNGIISDESGVFNRLQVDHRVIDYNSECPACWSYGMSSDEAEAIIADGYAQRVCDEFQAIVLSDTIPQGRPLYQALSRDCKDVKLILQITVRYDFEIKEFESWNELFASIESNPRVYFAPNNLFEGVYLSDRGLPLPPERTWVIRNIGIAPEVKSDLRGDPAMGVTLRYEPIGEYFVDHIIGAEGFNSSTIATYESHYGGPRVLSEYKFYMYLPYQASAMKVYENIVSGVFTVVPTPRLFRETMVAMHKTDHRTVNDLMECMERHPDDWMDYFDVYEQQNRRVYRYFDSWDELKELLDGRRLIDRAMYLRRMRSRATQHMIESMAKWGQLLN